MNIIQISVDLLNTIQMQKAIVQIDVQINATAQLIEQERGSSPPSRTGAEHRFLKPLKQIAPTVGYLWRKIRLSRPTRFIYSKVFGL